MTHPIVDLTFWSPGDPGALPIDSLLADPGAPLARHGLTGIAAAYARQTGATLAPVHSEFADHLTRRTLAADGALTEVVPALEAAAVSFFVAKGPAVAYRDYADPGLRPYADLDVYVPVSGLAPARTALAALGYAPVPQVPGALGGLGRELHGGKYGAVVEVHDHPIDNFQRKWLPSVEAFLEHTCSARLCGIDVPVLTPAAHVALQAIHLGAGHRYQKLVLYRDLLAAGCSFDAADSVGLGAGVHLAAIADVLRTLGIEVPCGSRRGVLHRPLVRTLVSRSPYRWDEYSPAARNVIAVANQPRWSKAATAALTSLRAARPRRGGRTSALRSRPYQVTALTTAR